VSVTIAGQQATVVYSGGQGTFAGLDELDVRIPQSMAGSGPAAVVAQVDGRVSNTVTIQIQ
jgi:uncharacterized protein (TIGR03437 family)